MDLLEQRGFTIIETIVYVAVFSVLMGGLVAFLQTVSQNRVNSQIVLEVNDQGNNAIQSITQALRNATAINSPSLNSTASSLSVNTASVGTTPTVFSVSSGTLYISEGASPQVALTNNKVTVSNLVFSNLSQGSGHSTVRVSFTLANAVTATKAEYNYSTIFYGSGSVRP